MSVGDGIAIGLLGLLIVMVVLTVFMARRSHRVRMTFEIERNGKQREGE